MGRIWSLPWLQRVLESAPTGITAVSPPHPLQMISLIALTVIVCMASILHTSVAFVQWNPRFVLQRSIRLASTAASQGQGDGCCARFNTKVDLASDKVVNTINLKPGEKFVACRCWQSAKFPACDGAHSAHNKRTGDNLGPVIITVPKE